MGILMMPIWNLLMKEESPGIKCLGAAPIAIALKIQANFNWLAEGSHRLNWLPVLDEIRNWSFQMLWV